VGVVTDPDTAIGFRLAGTEVFEAVSNEEAKKIIMSLIEREDMGIIAVDEKFMKLLDEKTRRKLEKVWRPVLVPISGKKVSELTLEERRKRISEIIKRAVGYYVVLKER